MKRIDWIVSGGNKTLKNASKYKKNRIEQIISNAIANTEEDAEILENDCVEIINSIKECADDSKKITDKLNQYLDKYAEIDACKMTKKALDNVKKLLNEDVEVEDEEDK